MSYFRFLVSRTDGPLSGGTFLSALAGCWVNRPSRATPDKFACVAPEVRADISVDAVARQGRGDSFLDLHPAAVASQCMTISGAHSRPREPERRPEQKSGSKT